MKKVFLFVLFLSVVNSLSATDFEIQGQWQEIKFYQVNHETGEVEYEEADQYIFLDEWVRIVKEDSRHEYRYDLTGEYLTIDNKKYIIISSEIDKLVLAEVWDLVGSYYISMKDNIMILIRDSANDNEDE